MGDGVDFHSTPTLQSTLRILPNLANGNLLQLANTLPCAVHSARHLLKGHRPIAVQFLPNQSEHSMLHANDENKKR